MQPMGENNGLVFDKLKQVLAENNSLVERLDIATAGIISRDKEIEILQQMLDEANEMRSNFENKIKELDLLQQQINEMKRLVSH